MVKDIPEDMDTEPVMAAMVILVVMALLVTAMEEILETPTIIQQHKDMDLQLEIKKLRSMKRNGKDTVKLIDHKLTYNFHLIYKPKV